MLRPQFIQGLGRWFTYLALLCAVSVVAVLSFAPREVADQGKADIAVFHKKVEPVKVLFVGDMMFDRQIRQMIEQKGEDAVFSCADETLKRYDVVVGNLEGPITHHESISKGSAIGAPDNFVFTFPLTIPKILFAHNIKIVNLGNNHILNFKAEGLAETRVALDEAGVGYFGGVVGNSTIYRAEIKGRKFSFVNYNEFGGESASSTIAQIQKEKAEGGIVVVYSHWGDEYVDVPKRVRSLTEQFLIAGADTIIGSHPHIVQGWGSTNGKPYYFSLGNFIFDQYWNKDVSTGLAVEVVFDGKEIQTKEFKVTLMKDGRSCIEASN